MATCRIGVVVLLALGAVALLASPVLAEPEEILPPPPTAPAGGETEGMPQGAPPTGQDPSSPAGLDGPAEQAASTTGVSPLDWRDAPEGKLADRNGPRLPATAGRSETEARQRLEGWEVRIEKVAAAGQYIGKVVDQHPDPGTTLARGETVTVVIAVGGLPDRHHRSVPRVEGKDYAAAVGLLTNAGAYVAVPKTVGHSATPGTIIDQMPRPGSIAKKGTSVVLLISRGGGEAPAPDDGMPPMEVLPPPPSPTVPAPLDAPSEHEAMPLEAPPTGPPTDPMPPAPIPPAPIPPAPMPPLPAPGPRAPASPGMPLPLPPVAAPPPAPEPLKLSAPRLLAPKGSRAAPRRYGANFHWTAVPGAEAYEWELQVEVATGQWETKDTQTVEGNRFRPKRLEKGRFRWRVRAIREGSEGAWSDFRRLYAY